MVWKIQKAYKIEGKFAFEDKKKGRPYEPLNPKFYNLIIEEWKENKCGARKLKAIFDRKGFDVSLRKISQVLILEGLQKPNKNKQKPRKYKRYEYPAPNIMWHTDWHVIKSEKRKGEKILVYIDDCSRKIMSYIIGDATSKNSIFALYKAIVNHNIKKFENNLNCSSYPTD